MARYVRLAWAVLLTGCVNLSEPLELRHRDAAYYDPSAEDGGIDPGVNPGTSLDANDPGSSPDGEDPGGDVDAAPGGAGPDATPPAPDLAPPDAPLKTNGSSCATGPECQSGMCVDKFCCESTCTGTCQACDLAGQEGKCTVIKAGSDPDNECDVDPVATCGRDGTCDGAGKCRRYPMGMVCVPGSCTGSTQKEASTCTAAGTCQPGSTITCMSGHTCANNSCATNCSSDGQCQTGFFCDGNACQLKKALGTACTAANQCASNYCIDGVCCNIACDQTCYACDLAGSVGTCNPVPDGQDRTANPECPKEDPTSCGRVGGCNGRGACRLFTNGTPCGAQTCTGSTERLAPRCNGSGTCQPGTTRDCGAFLCSGTACGTTCSSATQCKTGYACVGTSCRLIKITNLVVHDTVAVNVALWSLQNNFQIGMTGAHPWGEMLWVNTYIVSMDAGANVLLTKEWIHVATESKKYTGGPQATITLAAPSDVYLAVDDRWGTTPAWTAGWTNTNLHMIIYESTTRPMLRFTLFKKAAQTGNVDLPMIGGNIAYNYFVVVD
jgi:hypothetical protein